MSSSTTSLSEGVMPVASLQEFFRESLDEAMAVNRVRVDTDTAHYVVNLLTLFSRSEAFFESDEARPALRPLALMLSDALDAASPDERQMTLQRLGDVALFVAGFFSERLESGPVDLHYYVGMGGGAYRTLSVSITGSLRGRSRAPVFAELSAKFRDLVDVLNEVRESARTQTDADVLRLYEQWVRTGSRRAERLLRGHGVVPVVFGDETAH